MRGSGDGGEVRQAQHWLQGRAAPFDAVAVDKTPTLEGGYIMGTRQ